MQELPRAVTANRVLGDRVLRRPGISREDWHGEIESHVQDVMRQYRERWGRTEEAEGGEEAEEEGGSENSDAD